MKRPSATRTEQWEWTASMDGHTATATSELGAKYGVLCTAYDHLEAERDEYKRRAEAAEADAQRLAGVLERFAKLHQAIFEIDAEGDHDLRMANVALAAHREQGGEK